MSKITVVITTYNLEKQIDICLQELVNQSFQDFDIILVDDCSTDNTISVVEKYKIFFKERLQVSKLPNNLGSPAKTRNFALKNSLITGEYIIFLDGDDSVEQCFLSSLYKKMVKTNADVVVCAYDRIEEYTGKVLCKEMVNFPKTVKIPSDEESLCFINGSLWNKLFKTSLVKDIQIPDFKVGEDLCFQLLIYRRCKKIVCMRDILIHYNVRKGSIISNTEQATIIQFSEELLGQYQQSNQEFKEVICLIAFIHIGISMAIRAYDNSQIDISNHLRWTRNYFKIHFDLFKGHKYMSFRSLSKHGIKGYAIWVCKILYKFRFFKIFLYIYRAFIKVFHVDLKF